VDRTIPDYIRDFRNLRNLLQSELERGIRQSSGSPNLILSQLYQRLKVRNSD
jgi:hypothetical protein